VDNLEYRIFSSRADDTTGYLFVMPSCAISGEDLPLIYDPETKEWVVRQTWKNNVRTVADWEARDRSHLAVVLKLIALRLGYKATFEEIEENEDDGTIDS
jgi:hypothetical protein